MHPEIAAAAKGSLYVVATPIGNLRDITLRALDVLSAVEAVAAEDTRMSGRLLDHYGLSKRMLALHEHNERTATQKVLRLLASGKSVALVSDAGTPAVSDPGAHLVREARRSGFAVVAVPGPNAAVCALSGAGIPQTPFLFYGFLPARSAARKSELLALRALPYTLAFYEAPHRIVECVADLGEVLGAERQVVLARELTKVYETFFSGSLEEGRRWLEQDPARRRGEFVILVEGRREPQTDLKDRDSRRILELLLQELPLSQAVALASRLSGESRKQLYAQALVLKSGPGER